jgi:hypothetical protein
MKMPITNEKETQHPDCDVLFSDTEETPNPEPLVVTM